MYKKTELDTIKEQADILVEYANGGSFTIKIQNQVALGSKRGIKVQYSHNRYEVTSNKLTQLRKIHNVQTDF